ILMDWPDRGLYLLSDSLCNYASAAYLSGVERGLETCIQPARRQPVLLLASCRHPNLVSRYCRNLHNTFCQFARTVCNCVCIGRFDISYAVVACQLINCGRCLPEGRSGECPGCGVGNDHDE